MADKNKKPAATVAEALAKNMIAFGSEAHLRLIEAAYGMTKEKAETIVKERPANPHLWPYDLFEKAQNMLAAIKARPEVIDTEPGWHRERG
jgi:hypothetical protein